MLAPFLLGIVPLLYGLLDDLLCDDDDSLGAPGGAGAKVLLKCVFRPVSADGSGALIGSMR